jgi:signal transduction histidine kinase
MADAELRKRLTQALKETRRVVVKMHSAGYKDLQLIAVYEAHVTKLEDQLAYLTSGYKFVTK